MVLHQLIYDCTERRTMRMIQNGTREMLFHRTSRCEQFPLNWSNLHHDKLKKQNISVAFTCVHNSFRSQSEKAQSIHTMGLNLNVILQIRRWKHESISSVRIFNCSNKTLKCSGSRSKLPDNGRSIDRSPDWRIGRSVYASASWSSDSRIEPARYAGGLTLPDSLPRQWKLKRTSHEVSECPVGLDTTVELITKAIWGCVYAMRMWLMAGGQPAVWSGEFVHRNAFYSAYAKYPEIDLFGCLVTIIRCVG